MEISELVEKYRNDRRKLLEFLLSSNLIKKIESLPNSVSSVDVELGSISVDYVLNCINSGGVLNLSEANNKYREESTYPVAIESASGSCYFLCCDPDISGSPPRRVPPMVDDEMAPCSLSSNLLDPLVTEDIKTSGDDDGYKYTNEADGPCQLAEEENLLSFGLPILNTGLSEDDLRETAYELLLGSMIFSGLQLYSSEYKKKENKSRFLSRLKSKREQIDSQPQITERHLELLNIVRSQMQISEAMDACIRQGFMQLASTTTCRQIDVALISLELLNSIAKHDFPSEKLYIKWKKRQANILEELLSNSSILMTDEGIRIESFITMIRNNEFIETGETKLLDIAILEIQNVQLRDHDEKEEAYMNSLVWSREINGGTVSLNLRDAICLSISIWCDKKLKDYHQHFSQKAINFERVLTLFLLVGMLSIEESGDIKLIKSNAGTEAASRHLKACIENSIQATCRRLIHVMDTKTIKLKSEGKYPMAKLAEELIVVAEVESTVFSPVLSCWCPEAGMISSMHLHKFYGKKLNLFLDGVTCLSDDVRSVLPAADMLDHKLTQLYYSAHGENNLPFNKIVDHYQIGEVCKPIILDWLNGQHVHILEWTERAFDLEDWESLSFRQKCAASIIEVFRILEETVDQLFNLKLPLDVMHLHSLLSVIFRSLETYLLKMAAQLVGKNHLYPAAPALTRYKETVIPAIKKKSINCIVLEETLLDKLKSLTLSKLCVKVNTLQYIQNKLGTLEDGVRESWALVRPGVNERCDKEKFSEPLQDSSSTCSESVDGLFIKFNKIRKDAGDAMNTICDFIGTKTVFYDLRDSFLCTLYRGKTENARLECSLPQFDRVLDSICTIISNPLRDQVVQSICRASMDGYIWVLLEGGPSRAFLDTDIQLMQEDLQILKDFFVADGEGLPPAVVEKEAILAHNIVYLYSLQSATLIEMLMIASEQVSTTADSRNPHGSCLEDAHTLLRVLCHKKDRVASKFLKRQYHLPESSEYEDTSTVNSPLISALLKRSKSSHWAKQSQKSFRTMTKKLQEATSEVRHGGI